MTGALAEGEIAAQAAAAYVAEAKDIDREYIRQKAEMIQREYESCLTCQDSLITTEQLEETMQKVMDEYAGGISTGYRYNESRLRLADEKIVFLQKLAQSLHADNMDDLLRTYEVKERLVVCRVVIAHLLARKETRWHSFAENTDYPEKSSDWLKYVNSRMTEDGIQIVYRELTGPEGEPEGFAKEALG